MGKNKHRHKKHYVLPEPGSSPGLVFIDENSLTPIITLHAFNAGNYTVSTLESLQNLISLTSDSEWTYWVEIKGFKSEAMFEALSVDWKINKLILEDITRTYQRPKYEEYGGYDFAISRMLYLDQEKKFRK